jgi:immune inhibitor A
VALPDKEVVTEIGRPFAGSYSYYSGMGDNLDNSMTKAFNLPAGATLTAKVKYEIELDWDYAYLTVNGMPIHTNLSTNTSPNNQNFGEGITGSSGRDWVDLTADLSAFGGQTVTIGFRYWTDTYVIETGLMVDEISISGFPVDGAESDPGWSFGGFHLTTGTESKLFSHYYVAEYRTYKGYDSTLQVGPYYFGYLDDPLLQNLIDHFAYQDGLLLNYWDTSQLDNATSAHPGQGQILPIDAHPEALYRSDGSPWSNLVQTYDSTFTLTPSDAIPNIYHNSVLSPIPSLPAVSVFDDRKSYYDPANPGGSVITPRTGTQIRIVGISAQGSFIQIEVRPVQLNP